MPPIAESTWMTSEPYRVDILPKAEKDLDKLRQHRDQAVREIRKLRTNPLKGHTLRGSLRRTVLSSSISRVREHTGPSMSFWTISESASFFIVGSHENIYKEAERRYKAFQKR